MGSPTSRSLDELRRRGYAAGVVERHNTFSRKKNDLLGCIDLVAVYPGDPLVMAEALRLGVPEQAGTGGGTLGVQACAGASHAARRTKALGQWGLLAWLLTGNRFEVWSWAKRGKAGKRKLWVLRADEVKLDQPGVLRLLAVAVLAVQAGPEGIDQTRALAAFPPSSWGPTLARLAARAS